MTFMQQFKEARSKVCKMKRATPELFPQWHELQHAKQAVKEANERLARAKAAWDALGKD